MQVELGQRLLITLNDVSEAFRVEQIQGSYVYAESIAVPGLLVVLKFIDGAYVLVNAEATPYIIEFIPVLTAIPNIDIMLLAKVDISTLGVMCELSTYINSLCERDELWYARIENEYDTFIRSLKSRFMSANEFYMQVRRIFAEILSAGPDAALLEAARTNDILKLQIALRAGADIHTYDDRHQTALFIALTNEYPDIAKALIRADAVSDQNTALITAAQNGFVDVVDELLAAGADVNDMSSGQTALIEAAEHNHLDIVKALLAHRANINTFNNVGETALMRAVLFGNADIVRELTRHGADVNDVDGNAASVLMQAVLHAPIADKSKILEIVHELIAHGADVNASDNTGITALMWAAWSGNIDIVQELLNAGANVNAANNSGHTAIIFALKGNHMDVFRLLVTRGAQTAHLV